MHTCYARVCTTGDNYHIIFFNTQTMYFSALDDEHKYETVFLENHGNCIRSVAWTEKYKIIEIESDEDGYVGIIYYYYFSSYYTS